MAKKQAVSEEENRQYIPEPDKRDLFTERLTNTHGQARGVAVEIL